MSILWWVSLNVETLPYLIIPLFLKFKRPINFLCHRSRYIFRWWPHMWTAVFVRGGLVCHVLKLLFQACLPFFFICKYLVEKFILRKGKWKKALIYFFDKVLFKSILLSKCAIHSFFKDSATKPQWIGAYIGNFVIWIVFGMMAVTEGWIYAGFWKAFILKESIQFNDSLKAKYTNKLLRIFIFRFAPFWIEIERSLISRSKIAKGYSKMTKVTVNTPFIFSTDN